jgi:Glutaredoxin and related proteins
MPPTAGSLAMRFILYQRDDCQLCDQALALLAHVRAPEFDSVFIDGDESLEARYGERVPVLRDGDGERELDWPFDATLLHDWLQPLS